MKWTIYSLLAILISLIPCALYPEFIIPFSAWEEWTKWHDHKTVSYSVANPPPALRVIQPVFTAIVLPPTWIAERLGARRGMYSYFAASHAGLVPPGGSFHYSPPGLVAASEFLIFGIPFWFVAVVLIGQFVTWARRRAA